MGQELVGDAEDDGISEMTRLVGEKDAYDEYRLKRRSHIVATTLDKWSVAVRWKKEDHDRMLELYALLTEEEKKKLNKRYGPPPERFTEI